MAIPISTVRQALEGMYEIECEIGRGAMSTVFKGSDTGGREIALKVLRPEFAVTLIGDRFHREIEILSRLDHPNILPLYESGEAGHLVYYTMPFAPRGTVRDRLDQRMQLPLDETLAIIRDVAAGLDHAHRHEIIHRDIKPENIIFDADRALICDFGIARAVVSAGGERISTSGLVVGTPSYMSPEQAAGAYEIDHTADIYALACVVFEMLAGEPPFTGRSTQAIMTRQIKEPPRSIRVVRPELPEHVEAALNQALAKAPGDRPRSGGAFAALLETSSERG